LQPGIRYSRFEGEELGSPLSLQGIRPKLRLERTSWMGGRGSVEYSLQSLFGEGDGGYFATDGYRRGITHRWEMRLQAMAGASLHLDFHYLARWEPGENSPEQRMTAEARAFF
jgi:hypothetical protein